MDIDVTIFIIYLITNVGFGLYWGKKIKLSKITL